MSGDVPSPLSPRDPEGIYPPVLFLCLSVAFWGAPVVPSESRSQLHGVIG